MTQGDKHKERKIGVILGYMNIAVRMVTQLLYVPIMLRILGQSEYGVYQLVASIISYLGLLSFGFGDSYLRFYSQCKGDVKREYRLNGTFLMVFCLFALLALIVGCTISINTDTILGNKITIEEKSLARILFFILTGNMALTFPLGVFSSIVASRENFVFQRVIELIGNIANPFLMFLMLMLGKGSIGIVVVTTFFTIISGIVNIWYVKTRIKTEFWFEGINFQLIKEIGTFSFFVFLASIIDQINWNIDKYLLGRIVGTVAISVYSLGAQINTIYVQISDMAATVMVPKVNKIVARNENTMTELNMLFMKLGRIQALVIMGIVVGFVAMGKDFIMLWAGTEYVESYYVTLLLIVPVSIPLMQSLGIDIQRALNKHQLRSLVYAGLSILNLLISIPLIYKMGATGAALGTAISILFGNGLIMNIIYVKHIGIDVIQFWKRVLPIVIASFPALLSGMLINHLIHSVSWSALAIKAILFIMVYTTSQWFFAMNPEEKKLFTINEFRCIGRR